MTFTVTYRAKDGALREERVEAASRAECVAECRRRGIAPTKIAEGRSGKSAAPKGANGQDARSPSQRAGRPLSQWLIAVVLIAVVAGGAWWWFGGRGATEPAEEAPSKPKAAAGGDGTGNAADSKRTTTRGAVRRDARNHKTPEKPSEPALPPWDDSFITNRELRLKYSTVINVRTNEGGVVTERFVLPNGKTWRRVSDPPPIFDNPSDNAIAMALGDASGAPLPPVPGLDDANLDEEFAKSLLKPIEISEDDKPGVAAVKMLVSEARKEIAEIKNAGDTRTVGELLQEHVNMNNHAANLRGETLRQVSRVRREDGDAAAKEYLAKMNEALERFGVAPVEIDFEGEQP